jgi:hypothetical protein
MINIEIHCGRFTKEISKRTDYLLKGKQIAHNLTDRLHSSKKLKAQKLINSENNFKIISLDELKGKQSHVVFCYNFVWLVSYKILVDHINDCWWLVFIPSQEIIIKIINGRN